MKWRAGHGFLDATGLLHWHQFQSSVCWLPRSTLAKQLQGGRIRAAAARAQRCQARLQGLRGGLRHLHSDHLLTRIQLRPVICFGVLSAAQSQKLRGGSICLAPALQQRCKARIRAGASGLREPMDRRIAWNTAHRAAAGDVSGWALALALAAA
eukprot:CAMPEP_0171099764 /NCGR_PEP_ID=MMETSP0766_2-20121228/52514_1 /TAXON_ID=439317 /ORGANISM="Gambierdiscus australes, Strain CAWD 149" /LENGTH=153 /DNA_ID=CAMNT_0011559467 /DNA_START=97 /DNA_END=555 /DNA_ORIENTATION=-